jgi:hypothetical protein
MNTAAFRFSVGSVHENSGPAVRQHPGPGTESVILDACRLSLSVVCDAQQDTRLESTYGSRRHSSRGGEMPDPDRHPRSKPAEAPSDELVLAAVERAARHRAKHTSTVPVWVILEHLELARRTAAARHVRLRLTALEEGGWLERSRRHGIETWALTSSGQRRLQRARRAGRPLALPESPQHRLWRNARTTAGQEIERFRANVRAQLDEAVLLLAADPPPHSDNWFELADALQRSCRRLGSASYCLQEWLEPDDAQPDLDDGHSAGDDALEQSQRIRRRALRSGRRNVALWDDPPGHSS